MRPRVTRTTWRISPCVYSVLTLVGSATILFSSSRRRHTRLQGDWSSDVCSSDLRRNGAAVRRDFPRVGERSRAPPHRKTLGLDRKSTRLNSSHLVISYAVFCLKKKKRIV